MPGGGAADVAVVEPEAEGGLVLDGGGSLGGGHDGLQGSLFGVVAKREACHVEWLFLYLSVTVPLSRADHDRRLRIYHCRGNARLSITKL